MWEWTNEEWNNVFSFTPIFLALANVFDKKYVNYFFCDGSFFASTNGIKDLIRKTEIAECCTLNLELWRVFFALSKFSSKVGGLSYDLVRGD